MKKKLLIFAPYSCQLTDGGPSGFCAHNYLPFSSSLYDIKYLGNLIQQNSLGEKLAYKAQKAGKRYPRHIADFHAYFNTRALFKRAGAAGYSHLYFHDVSTLGFCHDLIRPQQVVFLQPHCPQLPHEELNGAPAPLVRQMQAFEQIAFGRANRIVLPNPQTFSLYAGLIGDPARVLYILSGAKALDSHAAIALDKAQLSFLYIGRRNAIKGFDLVLDAFQQAYDQFPHIRLYVIGNGAPVSHPGIIDVGFSNKVGLWLNSVDYLLNANRQSYFDLSMLECLSVGTPVLYSQTNGHEYFARYELPGLIGHRNDDLTGRLLEVIRQHPSFDPVQARKMNRELFQSEFTNEKYLQRFQELLSEHV